MANPNMQVGMPSVNPSGRPPGIFQDFNARKSHIMKTLSRSQILALDADPERMGREYSSFDCVVIPHCANLLRNDSKSREFAALERERSLDRDVGKPKQALTGGDEDDKPLIPNKIEIVLRRAE